MLFKTLTLEILRPSKAKRAIIDRAMLDYSRALEWLLERYHDDITELALCGKNVTSRLLLNLPDKESLKELNKFEVEPFKDSLKIEFSSIASAYIAQARRGHAGYPCVMLEDSVYHQKMSELISFFTAGKISKNRFSKEESDLISHVNRLHMIYFGRYSAGRDYCLLYDKQTGRFYAKLYLLNQKNRIIREPAQSSVELSYIANGMPSVEPAKAGRRYLILPLAFGSYQLAQLKRAVLNPGILHTARLIKRENHYFLLLNIECEQGKKIKPVTTMGVARSSKGLHYTVRDRENGFISTADTSTPGIYAISAKIVALAVKYGCQVVLEANGGKNDAVMGGKMLAPFSVTQYSALAKILSYKLPEAGLPEPVEVSANGLYNTCPQCGFKTYKNRVSNHVFACIDCGYACLTEDIGSLGLSMRLDKYQKDKIPIYYEYKDIFKIYYNKALDFECKIDKKDKSLTALYYQLSLLSHSITHCGSDFRKYSMVKKLRSAEKIDDVIRLVEKKRAE